MSTFTKLTNGRVIFEDGAKHGFIAELNVLPHPSADDLIIISPFASGQQAVDEGYMFNWNTVTIPSGSANRDALILELSENFFNGNAIVDSNNSTSTPLGISGVFTGVSTDILGCGIVFVSIFSDVASATDGLSIEQSIDGTNWDHSDNYTVPAGSGKNYSINPHARYFRIVYTNGTTGQSAFRLQIICKANSKPSSHRIQDSIADDDDAELMKAVLTGSDPNNIFDNVKISLDKALSVTNFLVEVARGSVLGIKMYSIPGRKDSLSQSALDDLTQIPGNIVTPFPGGIQLEIVSSSTADNGVTSTGILTIDIHYLDSNGADQEETIILNGTTPVNTVSTDIDFVQWIHAKTVGNNGVAEGNISLRGVGAGTTYEYITSGGNQSLSAKYKVPTGKIGYIIGWQASGISQRIDLRLRATVERFDRTLLPGVFLFQDILVLRDSTSGWIPFEVPLKMPAGAIIKLSATSAAAGGDGAGQFDILLIDD